MVEILRFKTDSYDVIKKVMKIVSDPKCPEDVLRAYARENKDIYTNEDKGYVKSIELACKIFNNPNCPKDLMIDYLYNLEFVDVNIISAIVRNVSCPVEILEKYSSINTYGMNYRKYYVPFNPKCPRYIFEKMAKDPNKETRESVAESPYCPEDILRGFIGDVTDSVVSNPKCPQDILIEYSSMYPKIISANPNCPASIFEEYIEGELKKLKPKQVYGTSNTIMYNMANNYKCPIDVLEKICENGSDGLIMHVAQNPNCTEELLLKICHSVNDNVILEVLSLPNCSANILRFLSRNNFISVKKAVLEHPNCPSDVPLVLAKNENETIRKMAISKIIDYINTSKCNASYLEKVYLIDDNELKKKIIMNDNCTIKILKHYINDKDSNISKLAINRICSIVNKPNCSVDVLEMLYETDVDKIKLAIIKNKNCPKGILGYYMTDSNTSVKNAAKKRYEINNLYGKFKKLASSGVQPKEVESDLSEVSKQRDDSSKNKNEIRVLRNAIFSTLKRANYYVEQLEKKNQEEADRVRRMLRINIPEEELFVEVGDHLEFRKGYLEFVDLIDFALVDLKNVKICGKEIRWDKSNAKIDPQTVYNKDLSGAIFADHNFTFKSFEGCNIQGADLSDEKDSYGYDKAIIDENTKLSSHVREVTMKM